VVKLHDFKLESRHKTKKALSWGIGRWVVVRVLVPPPPDTNPLAKDDTRGLS